MLEIGQITVFVVITIGLFINHLVIKKLETGVVNLLYISFGFAMFFVGLSQLFLVLFERGVYHLTETSAHTWLHLVVYAALASLVWGGYRVKQCIDTESVVGFGAQDRKFFGALLVFVALLFILPNYLESNVGPKLDGTFVETFGLHHFLVFIGTIVAGIYLNFIKGKWGHIGSSLTYVIVFLVLVGAQHGWEVITESWKIYTPEGDVIETIELVILIPAMTFFALGQWNFYKQIRG